MFFNAAIFSTLLLGSWAAPSGSSLRHLARSADVVIRAPTNEYDNPFWAGAALNGSGNGIYTTVTATFIVPTFPSSSKGSVSVRVGLGGIDGLDCPNVVFDAGVTCRTDQSTCNGWYTEGAADSDTQITFEDVTVCPGDVVKVTINAPSETSGTARIDNISRDEWEVSGLVFPTPICSQTAHWVVGSPWIDGELAQLANFGTVTLMSAQANSSVGELWGLGTAEILVLDQSNQFITSVATTDDSVIIQYLV